MSADIYKDGGHRPPLQLLNQRQRWILEQVAELFEILGAERAIDDSIITDHPDRYPLPNHNLVRPVHHRLVDDRANSQNETQGRINDGRKTPDSHSTQI